MLQNLMDRRPIRTADVTDVDLYVQGGEITDGNGTPVTLGTIDDDGLKSFANEDAGVRRIGGDETPTGRLRVRNGRPHVEGYGDVYLNGPYRQVRSVGNANGKNGPLFVTPSGRLRLYTTETQWHDDGFIYDALNDYEGSDVYTMDDPSSLPVEGVEQRNVTVRPTVAFEMLNYAIVDYWINLAARIDWDGGGFDEWAGWHDRFMNDQLGRVAHSTRTFEGDQIPQQIVVYPQDGSDIKWRVRGQYIDHLPSSNIDTLGVGVFINYEYKTTETTDRLVTLY